MSPLDSQTHTGKIIDSIIAALPDDCIKTNLANTEEMPVDFSIYSVAWWRQNSIKYGDIIVLLGGVVQRNFWKCYEDIEYIHAAHPSAFSVRKNKQAYVESVLEQIKSTRP